MEIQTQVVEGLCKLLLRGLIGSPKLLSRFVMLWFNPVSDNNSKLAHILGAFLPLYPSLSFDNQVLISSVDFLKFLPLHQFLLRDQIREAYKLFFQLALIESFPMTMETISDVPASSPLSKINPEEVGKFYIDVTSMGFLQVCLSICLFHSSLAFLQCFIFIQDKTSGMNAHDTFAFQLYVLCLKKPGIFKSQK
jgi:hypothetical protein